MNASRTPPKAVKKISSKVEGEQEEVDVAEPGRDPVDGGGKRAAPGDEDEEHAEGERDEWPGDGDPELGAGAREQPIELGDAAEQPQRDALDLQPAVEEDERRAPSVM